MTQKCYYCDFKCHDYAYMQKHIKSEHPERIEEVNHPTPARPDEDEVTLCKGCNTMKHVNADGYCGRCRPDEDAIDTILNKLVAQTIHENDTLRDFDRIAQARQQIERQVRLAEINGLDIAAQMMRDNANYDLVTLHRLLLDLKNEYQSALTQEEAQAKE